MVILLKILSETDIKRRCAVPMKYFKMRSFPKPKKGEHKEDLVVIDESSHVWIFCCSTRNTGKDLNRPKHPKPVLIKEWISFVESKNLRVGDRVIIYEEQGETGTKHLRIKVEKRTSHPEARWFPIMNQNLDGNKGSISHNSDNESTATFQPFGVLSADVLNRDLGDNAAVRTSSIDKEQISTPHGTTQHIAWYKTDGPSLSLSLELTLKSTMTGGTAAATSSSVNKEQIPTFQSTSQDIACNKTDLPSLSLSLGLALKPTMTGETAAATSSSVNKEQTPTFHSTFQDIACNKSEMPSLSLSLGLALKPTMTGETAAATSSSVDKEQTPTFHSTSQEIACNKTEMPSVSLSLGLIPKPTMIGGTTACLYARDSPKQWTS